MNVDMIEASHGRAPATASAIKRVHPNAPVFTYQGDGDLASIGMGELIHAAGRGEKLCTFFVNSAIYGMTGGQMAPTTLLGQKATTCVDGRTIEQAGSPMRICEMLCVLNANRPETDTVEGMLEHLHSIEIETGLKFHGLINNTHLLRETTANESIEGLENIYPIKLYMRPSWLDR